VPVHWPVVRVKVFVVEKAARAIKLETLEPKLVDAKSKAKNMEAHFLIGELEVELKSKDKL
jgi:hypothetical protein